MRTMPVLLNREGVLLDLKGGLKIQHLWTLLPFIFLVVVTFGTPLRVLDFWWHLKMGEVIVTTWSLPRTDIFSFTSSGAPFLLQSWLAEILFYSLYLLGGLRLIVSANSALLALALLCVYSLCFRELRAPRLSGLICLIVIVPLVIYSNVRPQVFSILLFAFSYKLLSEFRWRDHDRLWMLPVVMAAWVNLHGGFPLGLGLIGIFWLDALIATIRGTGPARGLPRLTLIGAATVAATLLNPAGFRLYGDVLAVLSDPPSQQFVSEWQAPQIFDWTGLLAFYVPFAATTAVLLVTRRAGAADLILYLVFSIFGFSALRNAIWFAILSPPLMARQLSSPSRSGQSEVNSGKAATGNPRFNLVILILMVCTVIGASPWAYPALKNRPLWEPSTPAGAVDFIESAQLEGNLFHPQIFGDFLIWRLWPRHRSFVDGRVHLFESDFVKDYFAVFTEADWEERLEPYQIRYLFLSRSDPRDKSLYEGAIASHNWNLLYVDDVAAVFEKIEDGQPPEGGSEPGFFD